MHRCAADRIGTMTPGQNDVWFLPLGGCGEIGMNLNLYGHDDSWLMVDCGVTFRDADGTNRSGYRVQMPDPSFIVERRESLHGIVLTHAHEDHIGAIPHLWKQLQCPIFATSFTAEMLRRKLVEHGLDQKVPIHLVEAGDRRQIGSFYVQWVAHTHSIPDPCGVVIETPSLRVFHTADWKLDPAPQVGHHYAESTYRELGESGVDVMVCDSTCAPVKGHSLSEGDLYPGLKHFVENAPGRVAVGCFGSNIARLKTLARIAKETDRQLGLLGRSLINTVSAARAVGLWDDDAEIDAAHLGYLPPEAVLLVATGSQGESRTALDRLSREALRELALTPGDLVLLSARAIPGNETDIARMMERFAMLGVNVVRPETTELKIHASGHPSQDELALLYDWTKPDVVIPVHGETEHMDAQVDVARACGIPRRLNGRNGDLFVLAPNKAIRRNATTAGRLGVGRSSLEKISTG